MAERLIVRGAREHNLKDVSLDLPRDALIVFTGLSGSGKSSLAFDTIFAEGQRRYVESLSAYARQFLGQMDKPDVDFIEGLSPAVSIDQKSTNRNPRSTVGTITEVYDYLRLLYARAGRPHCPSCGRSIGRQTPQAIVDRVLELDDGTRFQVLAPVVRGRKGEYGELFKELQAKGYSRARVDGVVHTLTEPPTLKKQEKHTIEVVIDRLQVKAGAKRRLTDSIETALVLGGGLVTLDFVDLPEDDPHRERQYSEHLYCPYDDLSFEELEPRSFSFNSPFGACAECHGLGTRMEVDPELVVPDPALSLEAGALSPWSSAHTSDYFGRLVEALADTLGFPHGRGVAAAARQGSQVPARRSPRPGARPLQEPVRPRAVLLHELRGGHPLRPTAARGGRERRESRALRGVHARGAVPRVPRRPPEARLARRDLGRALDRRRGSDADRGVRPLPARARSRPARGPDRRARAEGGQRATAVPARRRSRLPHPEPPGGNPRRGRGSADQARDTDRVGAGRGALRAGRAVHRPSPAGQPPPHRDAGAAARPRQHPDRGGARRGHDPDRGLGGRHRPGCR